VAKAIKLSNSHKSVKVTKHELLLITIQLAQHQQIHPTQVFPNNPVNMQQHKMESIKKTSTVQSFLSQAGTSTAVLSNQSLEL
jgi:hypothetical protein